MGSATVLYQNYFREAGSVVAVSNEVNGAKENAYELGTTNDFWKPAGSGQHYISFNRSSPVVVSAIGLAATNLFAAGTSYSVQFSTDGGSNWSTALAATVPPNNRPVFHKFPPAVAEDWRVLFTVPSGKELIVGVVALGSYVTFPYGPNVGYEPPNLNPEVQTTSAVSTTGNLLGTSEIRRTTMLEASIDLLDQNFVENLLPPFAESSILYPFFWNAGDADGASRGREAFYGKCTEYPNSRWSTRLQYSVRIRARGVI